MKYTLRPSARAERLASSLSVREALNQVCCPELRFPPDEMLGGAHIPRGTREVVAERVASLRAVCRIPPLCTADLECGAGKAIVGMTEFPDLMGLGANDSEELAYAVGEATAREGCASGINWTFSPCVDVAALADSPVVSTRSPGRDIERVIRTARGYLSGLQAHGVAATLKHFPGDGYTTFDQHLTTVQNPLDMPAWWRGPGRIYGELIEAGARSVMAGHIALAAWDEIDPELGLFPPATASRRLLTDLLRGELGFGGLLVSDAMGMGGVAGFLNPFESYARFLEAGGDMVLFPRVTDRRFHKEMERLLREGRLSESTLYDRASRVIAFKEDLGLLDEPDIPLSAALDRPRHQELALRVAGGAVALVRDRKGLLPVVLTPETRVLHVIVAEDYAEQKPVYAALTTALANRAVVEELVDPGPHALFERVGQFDLVVCSIAAVPSWGVSVARLHGPLCRNLMEGWMRLGTPVVFVSHVHPFVHLEFEPLMDCVVNTFRSTLASGDRIVRGLTGEARFTGKF